jgi:lysylphosphatidylglycerol synthetase-like protein (DUF2156 family)
MNQLMVCLIIFLLQAAMAILKVLEIRYNEERENIKKNMIVSFLISLVALLGLTIGISSVLKGDWFVSIFFVGGSVFGKWLVMTKFN